MTRRRRRVPWVPQTELADCGPASLAMALALHGRQVPLEDIRRVCGTGRDGATAQSLVEAATHYGLRARGVQADVDDMDLLPSGSILFWELNHFVVLDRVRRGGVDLVDPAAGRIRVGWDRFRRAYTGVAVELEPGEAFAPGGRRPRRAWRHARQLVAERGRLGRVVGVSVLLRALALALPVLTGAVVDRVVPRHDHALLGIAAAAMAVMAAFTFMTAWLRARMLLALRTVVDLRTAVGFLDHLLALPYAFHLRRSAGDLMMRLRSNAVVRELLTTGALSALLDGVLVLAYLVVILAVSVGMGMLVAVLGALQVAVLLVARPSNQRLMGESLQAEAKTQGYAYQLFAGIETLKAAGAETRAVDHWSNLFVDELNVSVRRGRLAAWVEAALATLRMASPLAVLLLGASQVLAGRLSLGSMLALAALAAGFLEPLATLVTTGFHLQLLGSYLERIDDVLDAPREQEGDNVMPAPSLRGAIEAAHVTFRYSPLAPPAVADVSVRIKAGQTVAIVGRSGSGKTTLAHLLVGLYAPDEGCVRHDGLDLVGLDARSVRSQLGTVTQDPYLLGVSIRQNVAFARPSATLDQIRAAAALACIDGDVEALPMGYDTMLVDGGATLSGGQRQRLALARALVGEPRILLLDEATSALDTVTEARVQANLAAIGCTTIVVAHRLSTITGADQILVMDGSRLVEQGPHAELLARGGAYAALVAAQLPGGGFRSGVEPVSPGRMLPSVTRSL
jgi:ATP-binding cassette subfamily B protein